MLAVFFWMLILLIVYSYLLYPLLLLVLSKRIPISENEAHELPFVTVIIPAYNEELLIEDKILSVLNSDYPHQKLNIIVGLDGATDKTESIIIKLMGNYQQLNYISIQERKGKSFMVNQLVQSAQSDIILLTDANIFFNSKTILNNVSHFNNEQIGLVGSTIINPDESNGGIFDQEQHYISLENRIKHQEGLIWGTVMAPFGACLAFRKKLFKTIPSNFLVDDFYISTQILKQKSKTIIAKDSICFEKLEGSLAVEFKRRIRISTGNFQNLAYFFKMFLRVYQPIGFCFWSHKGIRWFTPTFLITILFLNILLVHQNTVYQITLLLQFCFYCMPLTYYIGIKLKRTNKLVKFAHYFLMMNLALLIGFFHYLRGVKDGYWEVTQRVR